MNEALNKAKAEYWEEIDHVINVYCTLDSKKMLLYLKKAGHKWQYKMIQIERHYQGVK